jgi:hypothetical protein
LIEQLFEFIRLNHRIFKPARLIFMVRRPT